MALGTAKVDYPCPTAPFNEVYKAHAGVGGVKSK
jgi:hypothetical protein